MNDTAPEEPAEQSEAPKAPKLLSAWASSAAPAPVNEPLPSRPKRALLTGLGIGLVAAAIGVFVYGGLVAQGSYGKVSVAGVTVTKAAPHEQLEKELASKLSATKYTLAYPKGAPKSFTAEQMGISYDVPATVRTAKNRQVQAPWMQRLQWWRHETVPVELKVDEEKLNTFIATEAALVTEPAVNATLAVTKGVVETTPDKPGKAFQLKNAKEQLLASARQASDKTFQLQEDVIQAPVLLSDVDGFKQQIEKALSQDIVFTIYEREYRPNRTIVGSWVESIGPESKRAFLEFNSGSIEEYLNRISEGYVQLPRSEIVLTNPDGTKQILVDGRNGSDIKGKQEVAASTAKALAEGQPVNKALTVDEASYATINAKDYDKWLVVDITNKRMDAYEKDKLVRSFNVSAGAPATPTVLGQYKIYAKVRRQDMRGQNTDGSSYFQANVEWVNYFHESYAIHGNYWRPTSWFGNVNSSHGCVGIQNHDGQWIYEWAPVGTPVITHL